MWTSFLYYSLSESFFFIIITTNLHWPQIQSQLQPGQKVSNISVFICWVFKSWIGTVIKAIETLFSILIYLIWSYWLSKTGTSVCPYCYLGTSINGLLLLIFQFYIFILYIYFKKATNAWKLKQVLITIYYLAKLVLAQLLNSDHDSKLHTNIIKFNRDSWTHLQMCFSYRN